MIRVAPAWWLHVGYFKPYEFDSPDAPGSGVSVKKELVVKLDQLRKRYGRPINVSSGFRTLAENTRVGGAAASAHLTGEAADIRCTSADARFMLVKIALELGFARIGIYSSWIHLDVARHLPDKVCWVSVDRGKESNP